MFVDRYERVAMLIEPLSRYDPQCQSMTNAVSKTHAAKLYGLLDVTYA